MGRRVAITGVGIVSPVGLDRRSTWQSLTEGRTGIGSLTRFDASRLPIQIAAEVDTVGLDAHVLAPYRNHPWQTQFALAAAAEAVRQAGLSDEDNPTRRGVYLGCGELFADFPALMQWVADSDVDGEFHLESFMQRELDDSDRRLEILLDPSATAAALAACFQAHGLHGNCTSACASSSQAVGEAYHAIRRGDADVMLAGGAHSMVHPFGVSGFHRLGTLTTDSRAESAMRPFDRNRSGFVIGEGGAIVVLEELDHARRRGAEILAELSGYGAAQDAYRITDIHPQGKGASASIRRALDDARLNPEDIGYINAHGTSTPLNDVIETIAIKSVFGPHAYRTWISSTKSMLGHATTAGGALEAAACVMALNDAVIPPTVNYETPDPECDLDYVANAARERACRHVMSNSFGFGGQNVALVISQCLHP